MLKAKHLLSMLVGKKNGMIALLYDSGAVLVSFKLNLVSTSIEASEVRECQKSAVPLSQFSFIFMQVFGGKFG